MRKLLHRPAGWTAVIGLALWLLIGCGPAPTPAGAPDTTRAADGYPAPPPVATAVDSYPAPTASTGTLLALDKPIAAGATTVTGVGPPGLTVYIQNMTFMGELLGSAVVGADGRFTVTTPPLPTGIRLGLNADLAADGFSPEDVRPGSDAMSVPQVGNFFDTFVIR